MIQPRRLARHWVPTVLAWALPALLLIGCGSASTNDPIKPTRIVAFGDAMVDVGQTTTVTAGTTRPSITSAGVAGAAGVVYPSRYTINYDAPNTGTTFIEILASYFGFGGVTYPTNATIGVSGAYSYGEYGALVSGTTDARGWSKTTNPNAALSLQVQIDRFLAASAPRDADLFVISIGTGDIVTNAIRAMSLTSTTPYTGLMDVQTTLGGPAASVAATNAAIQAAAAALTTQVKRLTDAGAKYVLLIGPPNIGRSPFAATANNAALLSALSYPVTGSSYLSFEGEALTQLQKNLGSKNQNPLLFIDIISTVNTFTYAVGTFANISTPMCNSDAASGNANLAVNYNMGLGGFTETVVNNVIVTTQNAATPAAIRSSALGCTYPANGLDKSLAANAANSGAVLNSLVAIPSNGAYVYADSINFTPTMQAQLVNYALLRMRSAAWIN